MRKGLILFAILLSFIVKAQNYRLITPYKKQIFHNPYGGVHVIYLDSSSAEGQDSAFFDYRKLNSRFASAYCNSLGKMVFTPNRNCIWGSKIIETPDRKTLFITELHDTVFFPSSYALSDKWTLYKRDSLLIQAEVTAIDTETVIGGFIDSVVTLSLSCKEYPNLLINGKKLKIGSTTGLIQTIDFEFSYDNAFQEYRLIAHEKLKLGPTVPLFDNVFDFEAGDAFEQTIDNNDCGTKLFAYRYFEVLHAVKYGDTLTTYVLKRNELRFSPFFSVKTDTFTENFNRRDYLFNLPGQYPFYYNYHLRYNSAENELYQERCEGCLFSSIDSIQFFRRPLFEDAFFELYRRHTGMYQRSSAGMCQNSWIFYRYDTKVSYIKKGNFSWGQSHYLSFISGIEGRESSRLVKIYPNPVQQILTIEWNNHEQASLLLFDLIGREVFSSKLQEGKNELSLPSIPPGVYFYSVQSPSGITTQGKIIRR
ncbi:MAG: T9SS type A sorting domain-containing protein [Bacteroidia bacterium]|nr:T9SS type A sorting domain-containing protein [Bacteroidia bacterium]